MNASLLKQAVLPAAFTVISLWLFKITLGQAVIFTVYDQGMKCFA